MGSITTAIPTDFKVGILTATHNFTASTGDVFKLALVKDTASLVGDLGITTAQYGDVGVDELAAGNGYATGGKTLVSATPTADGTVAVCDFGDVTWTTATFTTAGGVIYNDTAAGKPVCVVLSFNGDQQVSLGDFQLRFPTADSANAIIRIS